MKVLVVARNPTLRSMIQRTLERRDPEIELLECEDGESARLVFSEARPEWVVIDLGASEEGGLETAIRLREENRVARILFLTDYNDNDYLNAMRAGGADDYLLKEKIHQLPDLLRTSIVA